MLLCYNLYGAELNEKVHNFYCYIIFVTVLSVIIILITGVSKGHKIVEFYYNYWDEREGIQENYYRNHIFYTSKDNTYHVFSDLFLESNSVDENNLIDWNKFDEETSDEYRKCCFIEINYENGDRIFASGKGKLPDNYEKVHNELEKLILSAK